MKGKEKCKALKEIREKIAKENDIPFITSQCTHQGDCKGTCPKCESELRYLERELAIRKNLGKAVAVVGISVGACSTLAACNPVQAIGDAIENIGHDELAGDVQMVDPSDYDGGLEPFDDYEGGLIEVKSESESSTETETATESDTEFENELAGEIVPDITCEVLEGDIAIPME